MSQETPLALLLDLHKAWGRMEQTLGHLSDRHDRTDRNVEAIRGEIVSMRVAILSQAWSHGQDAGRNSGQDSIGPSTQPSTEGSSSLEKTITHIVRGVLAVGSLPWGRIRDAALWIALALMMLPGLPDPVRAMLHAWLTSFGVPLGP